MDYTGSNFYMYDSEYFSGDKSQPKHNGQSAFLFAEDESMNFDCLADYTGLFQTENSIDLNAFLNTQSPSPNFNSESSIQFAGFESKQNSSSQLSPIETSSIKGPQSAIARNKNFVDSMPSSNNRFMQHPDLLEETAVQVKAESCEMHVEPATEFGDFDDEYDDDTSTYTSGPSRPASPAMMNQLIGKSSPSKRVRINPNKESDEYIQKRRKNNIAVRRSREKSKMKSAELQKKVSELTDENTKLSSRLELLTKELTVLKSLFTNVGKAPPANMTNM